jgi:hypothetical protein
VTGLADAKDFALVSFPCSESNGKPMAEMVVLNEGMPVPVGRRGGGCPVYAIAKADLDAWQKKNPMNVGPDVEALFKSAQVHRCSGGPSPNFSLPRSDPRDEVSENLRVSKLDAKGCVLVSADIASPPPTSQPTSNPTPTTSPATSPTTSATTSPSPTSAPSAGPSASPTSDPPPVARGCGGCMIGAEPFGAGGIAALGFVGVWIWRRTRPKDGGAA